MASSDSTVFALQHFPLPLSSSFQSSSNRRRRDNVGPWRLVLFKRWQLRRAFLLLSLISTLLLASVSRPRTVRTLLRLSSLHNLISFVVSSSVHNAIAALLVRDYPLGWHQPQTPFTLHLDNWVRGSTRVNSVMCRCSVNVVLVPTHFQPENIITHFAHAKKLEP